MPAPLAALAVIVLTGTFPAPGDDPPTFPHGGAAPGIAPQSLAAGDVTGDGRTDLVTSVGSFTGDPLAGLVVLRGDGFGGLEAGPLGGAAPMTGIGLADFDGDGDLDVAAMVSNGSAAWFEVGANGALTLRGTWPSAGLGSALAAGDIDLDGTPDVALAYWTADLVRVHTQTPDGGIASTEAIAAPGVFSLAIADVSDDGWPDVVTGETPQQRVVAYSRHPRATWTPVTAISLPGVGPAGSGLPRIRAIAAADFDADGDTDLAACATNESVAALRNDAGTLALAAAFMPVTKAWDVELADVDADAAIDLVAAIGGDVAVHRGNGAGGFGPALHSTLATGLHAIAIGSFDGDSHADVAFADRDGSRVGIDHGAGDGSFGPPSPPAGPSLHVLALGDFDHDGDDDALTAGTAGTATMLAFENVGGGAFAQVGIVASGATDPLRTAVADLDHDGDLDVAVAGGFGTTPHWLRGSSGLAFGSPQPLPVSANETLSVQAADVDGDSDIDLLVGTSGPSPMLRISVLKNDGSGTFTLAQALLPSGSLVFVPSDVEPADVDDDGDLDLVIARVNGPTGLGLGLSTQASTGAFTAPVKVFGPSSWIELVESSDPDLDGDADLALITRPSSQDFSKMRLVGVRNVGASFELASESTALPGSVFNLELADIDDDGIDDAVFGSFAGQSIRVARGQPDATYGAIADWFVANSVTPFARSAQLDGDPELELIAGTNAIIDDPCRRTGVGRVGDGCSSTGAPPRLTLTGCVFGGQGPVLEIESASTAPIALVVFGVDAGGASNGSPQVSPLFATMVVLPLTTGSFVAPVHVAQGLGEFRFAMQALVPDPAAATGYGVTNALDVWLR
jgi:hypothetical protein